MPAIAGVMLVWGALGGASLPAAALPVPAIQTAVPPIPPLTDAFPGLGTASAVPKLDATATTELAAPPSAAADGPASAEQPAAVPDDPAPTAAPAAQVLPPAATATETQAVLGTTGPVFPARRIVAYYGNPLAPSMGVLGQQPLPQIVQRLRQQARAYADADPSRPVQPALELITPVAQEKPGLDGLFRLRMASDVIDQVAQVAEREHFLLILDVQIGQSTVADELEPLMSYLQRPYVHLALDPEFAMADKRGKPGEIIGTLDAADVNFAAGVLGDLVSANHLPPKVLIVHRFLETMLTNYGAVHPTPSVQIVEDMDGFGSPNVKASKYETFVRDQPIQYGGVKLFYKYDAPLWSPAEVLQLDPPPDLVIYQ